MGDVIISDRKIIFILGKFTKIQTFSHFFINKPADECKRNRRILTKITKLKT